MTTKICNICDQSKDISFFGKHGTKNGRVQYTAMCKLCRNEKLRNKYNNENKEEILARNKKYYDKNKSKVIEQHKEYIKNNTEQVKLCRRKYYIANAEYCKEKHNEYMKTYFIKFPEKRYAQSARRRAYKMLKGTKKYYDEYLDCTPDFLHSWINFYIEQSEYSDMTLENYGKYWQIDHVVPCSLWDLNNDHHRANCFHWSNLCPMTAEDNASKKNKIKTEQILHHNQMLEKFAEEFNYETYQVTYPEDFLEDFGETH